MKCGVVVGLVLAVAIRLAWVRFRRWSMPYGHGPSREMRGRSYW